MSSPPQKPLPTSLYAVMGDDAREQGLADAISRLGATDALAAGTFFPPERLGSLTFAAAWADWLERDFEVWLGRRFVEVYHCVGRMAGERIIEIDHEIDGRLEDRARVRGRASAKPWLEGREEVRRQPQWVKYLRAQAAGETPGQITVIFALQSALFHLPLLPALTAYVHWEGVNGLAAMAGGKRLSVVEFASRHPAGSESARRVFQAAGPGFNDRGDDSGESPGHLACV